MMYAVLGLLPEVWGRRAQSLASEAEVCQQSFSLPSAGQTRPILPGPLMDLLHQGGQVPGPGGYPFPLLYVHDLHLPTVVQSES